MIEAQVRQPIAVYLPKSIDSIIAFLATTYSGNFYTPIDVSLPKARLESIFQTLRPAVILTNAELENEVQGALPEATIINISQSSDIKVNKTLLADIERKIIDTDPLYIMFTSGSSGIPKGVVVSHSSVIDYIEWLTETFRFSESTVFGNQAPLYFDNSIVDIYVTLRNACETVLIPEEKFLSSKRLCRYLDDLGVNTIFWVPSALVLVANSGILQNHQFKNLEYILFCGEVMPTKQLNKWRQAVPNAKYVNLYGPTEITDVCAYYIIERDFDDNETLPIGHACKNTEVLVLNEDNLLVSDNEVGELCVRGRGLARGYYRDMEKTLNAFIQNPLNTSYPERIYRTGDLVKYNMYGELVYIGRKDRQIKHMGFRIELGEIEAIASAFHSINNCCAVYNDDSKCIILVVTPENIIKEELFSYLKLSLPKYMLPHLITTLPALPLNANGKVNRKKVYEMIY